MCAVNYKAHNNLRVTALPPIDCFSRLTRFIQSTLSLFILNKILPFRKTAVTAKSTACSASRSQKIASLPEVFIFYRIVKASCGFAYFRSECFLKKSSCPPKNFFLPKTRRFRHYFSFLFLLKKEARREAAPCRILYFR